jgi:RsiW-degrading membrane proteinase PrsW (M82 family)
MRTESPIAAPMPVLHALAAALPGIGLVAMAGRGSFLRGIPVRGITWRQATMAAALAMSLAVAIAVYVESIGAAFAVVLLLVHHGAFEFASSSDAVFDVLEDADFILTENEQFVAGLIAAAVLAPISEELAKSLGVRFLMSPNSTRAQCFLLGAIAGAGFGFLEAMLYGLGGIADDLAGWWQIMVIRGGSTSLHVICSGLAGLGWWYWTIARRHRVTVVLFTIAILIHAGWNGVFTAIDSRIFVLDTLSNRTLEVIAYTIVGIVSGAMIVAVPVVARSLRPRPANLGVADGLTPWLA